MGKFNFKMLLKELEKIFTKENSIYGRDINKLHEKVKKIDIKRT
jgi:hypothetical protein